LKFAKSTQRGLRMSATCGVFRGENGRDKIFVGVLVGYSLFTAYHALTGCVYALNGYVVALAVIHDQHRHHVGDGAERDTAEEVEAYIQKRVPVQ